MAGVFACVAVSHRTCTEYQPGLRGPFVRLSRHWSPSMQQFSSWCEPFFLRLFEVGVPYLAAQLHSLLIAEFHASDNTSSSSREAAADVRSAGNAIVTVSSFFPLLVFTYATLRWRSLKPWTNYSQPIITFYSETGLLQLVPWQLKVIQRVEYPLID